jgi:DNA-binding beta-propeller fold protein YncE
VFARRARAFGLVVLFAASACAPSTPAAEPAALALEARIPLGAVKGRIDHLAVDEARDRLFVAELGNDSVDVIDLKARRTIRRISGLDEPQGLGFVVSSDDLYVANGGDGSVRIFSGADLKAAGRIDLGEDADDVRVDPGAARVYVAYGAGGLAVIDAKTRTVISRIALSAHPEGFQLDPKRAAVYVNLPGAHRIDAVDRATGKRLGSLPTGLAFANFPMALDARDDRLAVAFRAPPQLQVLDLKDDKAVVRLGVCSDADDVFFDDRRNRLYVICGQGVINVVARTGTGYRRVGQTPTAPGGRTGLWEASEDRLYVAIPARPDAGAAVLVFRAGR